jgi:hypothetical protein
MTAWMLVLITIYGSWALELLGAVQTLSPCVPGVCTFASETGVRVGVVSFKVTCGMPGRSSRWMVGYLLVLLVGFFFDSSI